MAPPTPQSPPPPPAQPHGAVHRFATSAKHIVAKSLRIGGKVVGLVTAANIALYCYEQKQVDDFFGTAAADNDGDDNDSESSSKRKKRVLVLPFDNLNIVERRKSNDFSDIQPLLERSKQPTITLEAKELVDIIHNAASDPNITALYADFGEGMRYPVGYAHIEEIRNAIRIFNESHRVHREPNVNHNPIYAIMMRNGDPKLSYAYGHTFDMSTYFLASAFSFVHLQCRGNLDLFGVATTNVFLRGMLDKYGIKAHVFRHGEYKSEYCWL